MKPFFTNRRKIFELLLLMIFSIVLYFIWNSFALVMLFSLGFIWNWTASQDLNDFFINGRYRFSLLKMVFNLQHLFVLPFKRLPRLFHIIPKALPAGIFWWLVTYFAQSEMPWPATFLGSFVYELTQVESYLSKSRPEKVE